MGTPARKVALIDVKDYPRDKYSAYWSYSVVPSDEGLVWKLVIESYKPTGYAWKGKVTPEWPADVPHPVYPPGVPIMQDEYLRMTEVEQAKVRALQDKWRAACAEVYEAHPKAVHNVETLVGAVTMADLTKAQVAEVEATKYLFQAEVRNAFLKDVADTQAQQAAIKAMKAYKIPEKPAKEGGHAMALGPGGMVIDTLLELGRRLLAPLLALAYSTTIRTNRLTQIINAIDGGAGAGLLRMYDGSRPATCGTATTLLAEITLSDPCATESGQVLTFDNTPALTDASANATGTTSWHRFVDSTGACCVDGNCGTSGSDINFNSVSISSGQTVTVSSYTITAGNA